MSAAPKQSGKPLGPKTLTTAHAETPPLPPTRAQVAASAGGKVRERRIKLTGKRRRRVLAVVLGAVVVTGLVYYLWPAQKAQDKPKQLTAVEALPVERSSMVEYLTVVGQVQANQGVQLKSEITGRVARLPFKEGARVTAGTVLVQLDDSILAAQLAQAEATLTLSENNVGRYQRLLAENASSQQQLDSAEADLKLARANVQLAKAQLDRAYIRAPLDGTAGIRQVNVGDYIQPGQALVSVTENDKLRISFRVPEQMAVRLRVGMTVTISSDSSANGAGVRIVQPISAIDGQVDPASRTREVQVLLDRGEEGLVAGQFVRVAVPGQRATNAVSVPDQALVPSGDKTFVYVVREGDSDDTLGQTVVSRTTVTVGLRAQNRAQILGGLRESDRVVTAGQQRLLQPVMPVRLVTPTEISVRPSPVEELPATEESIPPEAQPGGDSSYSGNEADSSAPAAPGTAAESASGGNSDVDKGLGSTRSEAGYENAPVEGATPPASAPAPDGAGANAGGAR